MTAFIEALCELDGDDVLALASIVIFASIVILWCGLA